MRTFLIAANIVGGLWNILIGIALIFQGHWFGIISIPGGVFCLVVANLLNKDKEKWKEELDKAVWQILCEIKQEQLATPSDQWIIIDTNSNIRERAVRVLAKTGGIKALEYQYSLLTTLKTIRELNGVHSKPSAYKVEPKLPRFEEIFELYEGIFNHDFSEEEIKTLTDQIQALSQSANEPAKPKATNLSTADQKKLLILERLKEEWDLTPLKQKLRDKYLN